jgi:transposase, IS5 family
MQPKRDEQSTFFDLAVQQRRTTNKVLETINREVDFSIAERRIAATYSSGGRPACRVGVLLRIMILQHLYGLSDPQVEEQLNDRLSFQKFVQLAAQEAVPDETTICRFRQRLIDCGLHEELLDLLNGQLEARGYIVKRTTLVDATIIESSRKYPSIESVEEGTAPDADAGFTRKNDRSRYGYKAHVASDGKHQLVRRALVTSATIQEMHFLEPMIPPGSKSLYADKGYACDENRQLLKSKGIKDGILKKAARHVWLTKADLRQNDVKEKMRSNIERVFAHWKQWQHYRRVRYLGLVKNQLELTLKAVAYNLKRLVGILEREKA